MRTFKQDSWKRTQIRMPPTLYQAICDFASVNQMSLNQAMIELMGKSLGVI